MDTPAMANGSLFAKKTLVHSPIITNIFPAFNVDISKKFHGLTSSAVDESDQYLVPKEDSQMDVFADDDDVDYSLLTGNFNEASEVQTGPSESKINLDSTVDTLSRVPTLVSIKVLVRITSILVNNVEFSFPAAIRSSCIVNGLQDENHGACHEDSLLISLKSGFLFLIRIFHVPREFTDKYYNERLIQYEEGEGFNSNFILKPFIVQWWDTGNSLRTPSLDTSGYSLYSHSSGLSCVSASPSNVFRIYNTKPTEYGTCFEPHINVTVDGLILNACFSQPLENCVDEAHILFLALVFTELKRLQINMFEWTAKELTISEQSINLVRKTLPLNNTFPIPIHIIPLRKNSSFLFVSDTEIVIVTIHQIMSVEYEFVRMPIHELSGFPTSFYIPFSKITNVDGEAVDEVLLATDAGAIFSVIVSNNTDIKLNPIVQISDPISHFAFEKHHNNEYNLIFGSDTGSNREVVLSSLLLKSDFENNTDTRSSKKYSKTRLITDYKNWAPLLDVQIVESPELRNLKNPVDQELWALSGVGKRTRLTLMRNGYSATRSGKIFTNLRKAESIFIAHRNESTFFILSYPFETKIFEFFEFAENESEMLQEIDEDSEDVIIGSALIREEPTIAFSAVTESTFVQITESSICATNLSDSIRTRHFGNKRVILCDIFTSLITLVSEYQLDLKITRSLDIYEYAEEQNDFIHLLSSTMVPFEPSMAKTIKIADSLFVGLGSYEGKLVVWDITNSIFHLEIDISNYNPYHEGGVFNDNENFIPNDIISLREEKSTNLFIGTKDGYLLNFEISNEGPMCKQFLKISDTSVSFFHEKIENKMFYIYSRNLWFVNFYQSRYPQKVYFNETTEKAIFSMVNLNVKQELDNGSTKYFAFLREDGVSVGSIQITPTTNTKYVTIGENAKKMLYLPFVSSFFFLCQSKKSSRFKFIDRKLLKALKHTEFNKNRTGEPIIGDGEFALSTHIWFIQRNENRVSKKVLVGFEVENKSKGLMKILDISTNLDKETGEVSVIVSELNSFEWSAPITQITQIGSTILFVSGGSINSTSYNILERKLQAVNPLKTFSSPIVSIFNKDNENELLVTTRFDSIYKCKYFNLSDGIEQLQIVAKDPSPKSLVNETQTEDGDIAISDKLHSTVMIMNTNRDHLQDSCSVKVSSIARVVTGKFNNIWDGEKKAKQEEHKYSGSILCVGVNGEIVSVRRANTVFPQSTKELPSTNEYDLPFTDKLNGKGLFSLYKPYFNYQENHSVIDLDLEVLYKESTNITI